MKGMMKLFLGEKAMVSIWYEVFPVTLVSKQPVLIRRAQELKRVGWKLHHLPNNHPNDVVISQILNFFGDACDLHQTIVHSTSWRYEQNQLLLTYLAVLPQGPWIEYWRETGRISLEPVGMREKCYGDHLFPPEHIEYQSVLAHALDHLASLITYDLAIQEVLEPEWKDILAPRLPKSAGCLQKSSPHLIGVCVGEDTGEFVFSTD
jgi:hypothetical protein